MVVHLCKKALDRLPDRGANLSATLREREHVPVVKDCLERCVACDRGVLVAACDGAPVSAGTADKLLATVDALAEDE